MRALLPAGLASLLAGQLLAGGVDPAWRHSRSLWILTTPHGVPLAPEVRLEGFPLLVRFDAGNFDFAEARPDGTDLRFTTGAGQPLAFQIEEWNPVAGQASVWVRIPEIRGGTEQEIRCLWGNPAATTASDGGAVFNEANGFAALWHLDALGREVISGRPARDTGTEATPGPIGPARRFTEGHGWACGEDLDRLPGGSSPSTTEAWIRPTRPNATIVGWGNEQAQGKIVLQFRSPPHVEVDAYFSDANVRSRTRVPLGEWTHVAHTYERGQACLYVNGVLTEKTERRAAALNIRSPARAWIGGWYGHYTFEGDLDEVRVSRVARPPEWIRLQFENQKPNQLLVGHGLPAGPRFGIQPRRLTVREGSSAVVHGEADGARKVSWVLVEPGRSNVLAVDRLECPVEAARFSGQRSARLELRAVHADGVRSTTIPVRFEEAIADPDFELVAPRDWNGRNPIRVIPRLKKARRANAAGATPLRTTWKLDGPGTTHEVSGQDLLLTGALQGGALTVTATLDNGGPALTRSCRIHVAAPGPRPWLEREPGEAERPVDNQFYARGPDGLGTVFCTGRLPSTASVRRVFLRLASEGGKGLEVSNTPDAQGRYRLSARLPAGLVRHTIELGALGPEGEQILHRATNVVCGDVFLIQGQSNAVSTDWGPEEIDFRSPWIRTYGGMTGDGQARHAWGEAVHRSHDDGRFQVGYWGMELARQLVEKHRVPICLLNGAVGGTRLDQHQRNAADPIDGNTIYGRLLRRVREAGLTHGVRGIFWHQGENDQGADGPSGGFGWETYRALFIQLAGAWRQDYPNAQRLHAFQIWPKACAMGVDGSDNRLREVQRNLPTAVAGLTVLATLGIEPPGGCHFPAAGYAQLAALVLPVVERDHHGRRPEAPVTSPNLLRARFADTRRLGLVLEFDQPVRWSSDLASEFTLDDPQARVTSGRVEGNALHLDLSAPAAPGARRVTYLDSARWSQSRLLRGTNGLAALTFCEVPVE